MVVENLFLAAVGRSTPRRIERIKPEAP